MKPASVSSVPFVPFAPSPEPTDELVLVDEDEFPPACPPLYEVEEDWEEEAVKEGAWPRLFALPLPLTPVNEALSTVTSDQEVDVASEVEV